MSISICGQDFKDAIVNGQQRHIKSTTTEIEHKNVLLSLLLVQTVSNGGSSPAKHHKTVNRIQTTVFGRQQSATSSVKASVQSQDLSF